MAYAVRVAQNWVDGSASTPLSAARMNDLETGTFNSFYAPAVRVYRNGVFTLNHGVDTVITFDNERFDQAGNAADTQHDNVTNNSRLTCRYAGVYQISATVEFVSNATGIRYLHIRLNGTTDIAADIAPAVSGSPHRMSLSTLYQLAVNDYVELGANQTSGGNLNISVIGNSSPEFMMVRVG